MPGLGRVGAVYFDLYGTLLDLGPLDGWCEAIAPGRGADFARTWRTEQLRLTWLRVAWLRPKGASTSPAVGGPDPIVATWPDVAMFATGPASD